MSSIALGRLSLLMPRPWRRCKGGPEGPGLAVAFWDCTAGYRRQSLPPEPRHFLCGPASISWMPWRIFDDVRASPPTWTPIGVLEEVPGADRSVGSCLNPRASVAKPAASTPEVPAPGWPWSQLRGKGWIGRVLEATTAADPGLAATA